MQLDKDNPESGMHGISKKEALDLLTAREGDLEHLLKRARAIRHEIFGNAVRLCAIINAKSGKCGEKCSYCSQSKYFDTGAVLYPLKSPEDILDAALRAEHDGADDFSIVTSGRSTRLKREISSIVRSIQLIKAGTGMRRCASLGELHPETYFMLAEAGLQCYHHNVETAPSHHPQIVMSHSFEDEVRVIEQAKAADLATCCGGIFGMGETDGQRAELIFAIRDVDPDHVPLNFLNPIKGTPLENMDELTPEDCLRIIAVCRLALPGKHIIICGGRERNLGGRQTRMFDAGATGAMTGDYLTTKGQSPRQDREMIRRAGYRTGAAER